MNINLKNKEELFEYLMYGYCYNLEEVETKNGIQKRLKDNELELYLKKFVKENIKVKDLLVELKLGPSYNRSEKIWIQLYTIGNKSGAKGRYVGISFSKETNEIEIWVGFGRTRKKQLEIYEIAKEYKVKYSLIEPNLKYGFEYNPDCMDAIIIKKVINKRNFEEKEFEKDLEYITDLYKQYEMRFGNNLLIPLEEIKNEIPLEKKITYQEINEKMLTLIEEVGNLAKTIKELGKL